MSAQPPVTPLTALSCQVGVQLCPTVDTRNRNHEAEFPLAFTQQEGDIRCSRSASFKRLADGETERRSTIEVKQLEQLGGLASGRFSVGEGQIQKRFALRHGLGQAAGGSTVKYLALLLQQYLLMLRIEHSLVAVVAAAMAGDLLALRLG